MMSCRLRQPLCPRHQPRYRRRAKGPVQLIESSTRVQVTIEGGNWRRAATLKAARRVGQSALPISACASPPRATSPVCDIDPCAVHDRIEPLRTIDRQDEYERATVCLRHPHMIIAHPPALQSTPQLPLLIPHHTREIPPHCPGSMLEPPD